MTGAATLVDHVTLIYAFCLFVFRNANKIAGLLGNGIEESLIPNHINLTHVSQVTAKDYHQMIEIIKGVKEDKFDTLGLDSCSLNEELNKVRTKRRKGGSSIEAAVAYM